MNSKAISSFSLIVNRVYIRNPRYKQPRIKGDTERNWQCLVREFVKDIKGEVYEPYQTFKEGSLYQRLIDIIRKNENSVDVLDLQ